MRNQQPIPDWPQAPLPLRAVAQLQDSLRVATHDLDRLQRLLTDATETLLGHFYGALSQISQLSRLAATQPVLPEHTLHQTRAHLAGAVTALQFQDMASQLINHTHRRLQHCADQLAHDGPGPGAAHPHTGHPAAPAQSALLQRNPVAQDEMHAGSVELF